MTPAERHERASIAAREMHARNDPRAVTAAAREAVIAKYRQQADPHGTLDAEERDRRARHLIGADLHRARLANLKTMANEGLERAATDLLAETGGAS